MRLRGRSARRFGVLLVAGVGIVAAAAHVLYYFSPRERAGLVSGEFAAWLAPGAPFDRTLWIASPHQNLGALDERVGDLESYLAAVSRLAGARAPRLPGFGPFAVPPAREVAIAWNGSGESFLGVARIEPGVSWVARLAGRLAGNPWLAGGKLESAGRQIEVRWRGSLWIVASGLPAGFDFSPEVSGNQAPADADAPAIARLVVRRESGPLPQGRFVLARGADGLEVRSGVLPENPREKLEWSFPGVALWLSATDRGPVGGPGLFLLWGAAEGGIPRLAVLQRGGGRTFRLPGESILEFLGEAEPAVRLGWTVRATQKSARRDALLMVPWFERHLPRPGGRGAWLGRAGRLEPVASARTLALLAESLAKLPLLPASEVQRISAAAQLLIPFQDCAAIAFEVWHEPEGARLRLCSTNPGDAALRVPMSSPGDGQIDEASPIR